MLHQSSRRGLSVGTSRANRKDAVIRLDEIAVAREQQNVLLVRHDQQRIQAPQRAIGAPVLPANPATTFPSASRRSLRAPCFTTVSPRDTCPSAATAVFPSRRTARTVVARTGAALGFRILEEYTPRQFEGTAGQPRRLCQLFGEGYDSGPFLERGVESGEVNPKRLTHRELLSELSRAESDDPLWLEFVARFQSRIRLVVYRTFSGETQRSPGLDTGSLPDAVADLTQDVFLKLLDANRRAITEFRGQSEHSIFTYLNAIAVNVVRDHFKKLRARKTPRMAGTLGGTEEGAAHPSEGAPRNPERTNEPVNTWSGSGPEQFVAAAELRARIQSAIDEAAATSKTSRRDRLVFRLFFLEGLTVDEIAAAPTIGLSSSGVEKCIRRIRDTVKQTISREEGGSAR